ncbi:hypothetical protein NBRC3293_2691 [Gluconobacter oxydans NBRC 3293]|uniref:Uncharacterized protein n=1 Tax=Gluconobacter oxydans NBRC 3293 TaxID=1315969 RepID=A0A829WSP6_GLUOY|nr:hypothetical protein NBRC3293_2691 [Gluconobacter oxydans NBRC 3293]
MMPASYALHIHRPVMHFHDDVDRSATAESPTAAVEKDVCLFRYG